MDDASRRLRRSRAIREIVRWLILLAAVALAWPLRTQSTTSFIVPALSPLIAAGGIIAARTAGVIALLAVPVLVLALIVPRWFCRYGCPVGLLQEYVARLRPRAKPHWLRWPELGRWLLLIALGGALLGYPLFLWLDPLAIFHGFLNAWRRPPAVMTLLTGLGLPLLLLLELVMPRLWCRRICPLGAGQDLLTALRRVFQRKPAKSADGKRRWFLAGCAAGAGAIAARAVHGQSPPPLRPPGALAEREFMGTCVRCGNCAQACPAKIIEPDFGSVAGFLAPRVRFEKDYCREDCHRCGQVCPSGAIARLDLKAKRQRKIGLAMVNLDTCLLAAGGECTACIRRCPYQAIAMASPDGGFSNEPRVLTGVCNGCGACEMVCPTRPARSIVVRPGSAQQ